MDIVTRIKTFLSLNGIANSIFADTCDIPRPTVSQLLNGRNKKISNEVLDKIHVAYPSLSMMWLMFGEEPMMLNNGQNENNPISGENSIFASEESSVSENSIAREESEASNSYNLNRERNANSVAQTNGSNVVSDALVALAKNLGKHNQDATQNANVKKIVNIMVFYSDNSFESFVPNK